jgi:hypothetical protein
MGMVLLKYGLKVKRLPLLESNGFGRSPELGLRNIPVKNLPLFWLEVRWMSGQWVWRSLNSEDDTKGKGNILPHGWRTFQERVYFRNPNVVLLELFDASPPEAMVESLTEGQLIPTSEFLGLHIGDAGYRIDPEGDVLTNGSSFVHQGQAYRLWLPQNYAPSVESILHLSDENIKLDIYPKSFKAVFSAGANSAVIQGEMVRVLWMYSIERQTGEGWVDSNTALDAWMNLGGNASSDVARISWERNKLRKHLLDQSVLGVDHLFERYRQNAVWFHRLSLSSSQIAILEE